MCSHKHFSPLLSFLRPQLCQLRVSCVMLCVPVSGIMEGTRTPKSWVCCANPAWFIGGDEDLCVNMDQRFPADGSALLKEVKVLANFAFSLGFLLFCNFIGTSIPFAPEINLHFLSCSLNSISHPRAVVICHSNELLWGSLSNKLLFRMRGHLYCTGDCFVA